MAAHTATSRASRGPARFERIRSGGPRSRSAHPGPCTVRPPIRPVRPGTTGTNPMPVRTRDRSSREQTAATLRLCTWPACHTARRGFHPIRRRDPRPCRAALGPGEAPDTSPRSLRRKPEGPRRWGRNIVLPRKAANSSRRSANTRSRRRCRRWRRKPRPRALAGRSGDRSRRTRCTPTKLPRRRQALGRCSPIGIVEHRTASATSIRAECWRHPPPLRTETGARGVVTDLVGPAVHERPVDESAARTLRCDAMPWRLRGRAAAKAARVPL